MKNNSKKRKTKIILPERHWDFSDTKPPTRPAIETMIENLHNAAKLEKQ